MDSLLSLMREILFFVLTAPITLISKVFSEIINAQITNWFRLIDPGQ
jgi:hypothetical protein